MGLRRERIGKQGTVAEAHGGAGVPAQEALFAEWPVDYLICGQHFLGDEWVGPYTGAPTDRADANVALGDELGRLLGAVRDMTALRDDDEYRKALDALANATTAVSNARGEYNEVVLKENKIVDGFPGKLIAPLFKLEPREYFNARVVEDEAQNSGGAAAPYSSGVTTSVEPLPPADGK